MTIFDPAENTVIAVYGPPEYFESLNSETQTAESAQDPENQSFFSKLIGLFKKLFEVIKGLFVK